MTVPPSSQGKKKSMKDSSEKKRGPTPGKSPSKAKRRASTELDEFVEPAPAESKKRINSQNSTKK